MVSPINKARPWDEAIPNSRFLLQAEGQERGDRKVGTAVVRQPVLKVAVNAEGAAATARAPHAPGCMQRSSSGARLAYLLAGSTESSNASVQVISRRSPTFNVSKIFLSATLRLYA